MNERIRSIARQSHIDVYALGLDQAKWEAALERYTEMVILECDRYARSTWEHGPLLGGDLKRLFGFEVEE